MALGGYADFKSHVLRRDEKGMFGVPFKRLLLAGFGGGLTMTVTRLVVPDIAVILAFISAIALIVLTAPRGGIPRWKHIVYDWRWRLMTAASLAPSSVIGALGQLLNLPADRLHLDGTTLFRAVDDSAPRTELTDWISFARLEDVEAANGLVFAKSPDLHLQVE